MHMKKRVCIIYTGGTIGMVPGENGYIPSDGKLDDDLAAISDLHKAGMPELEVIQFSPLLDSSNVSVAEWNKMGRTIAENYDRFDGFVILHGTDTMSYSASALSFMLENLDKPVIFTGAQIPLCEIRSDGYNNIVASVEIAFGIAIGIMLANVLMGNCCGDAAQQRYRPISSQHLHHLISAIWQMSVSQLNIISRSSPKRTVSFLSLNLKMFL